MPFGMFLWYSVSESPLQFLGLRRTDSFDGCNEITKICRRKGAFQNLDATEDAMKGVGVRLKAQQSAGW
jgi:hypothetical protein